MSALKSYQVFMKLVKNNLSHLEYRKVKIIKINLFTRLVITKIKIHQNLQMLNILFKIIYTLLQLKIQNHKKY